MTTEKLARKLLICNCDQTMPLNGAKLSVALDLPSELFINSSLCRSQIDNFRSALKKNEGLLVACTQEAPLFREIASEEDGCGEDNVSFVNIRELAGWSDEAEKSQPKMVALIEASDLKGQPTRLMTLRSSGNCLVYGGGQIVYDTALKLSQRLSVILVLSDPDDLIVPATNLFPMAIGKIEKLQGALGRFKISLKDYATAAPSSRSELSFGNDRTSMELSCDLVFDLSGEHPLVTSAVSRDGYFRVDPSQAAEIASTMYEICDFVGEFEKPIYVDYEKEICAHGRSGKVGCTKCLDHCPASAITSAGDFVLIDGGVCGGCGNCHALCPTGAIQYSYPRLDDLVTRIQQLLKSYKAARGSHPALLFCDEAHGLPMISAMSRYGKGLPANVLPVSLHSVLSLGHETLLAAFGAGASHVKVLVPPARREELSALNDQIGLCNSVLEGLDFVANPQVDMRAQVLIEQDPFVLEAALYELPSNDPIGANLFTATGSKRDIAHMAFNSLFEASSLANEQMELPGGAPYGIIQVDSASCTLCLACVGSCPAHALLDGVEQPQLRFHERNCVQCGLCAATCPENAITLAPRYNFSRNVQSAVVLHEDEPLDCIRCNEPFGSKRAIERVSSILAGKNPMFQTSSQLDLLKMCDDCRIISQSESSDNPMAMGEVPRVRTTEEYLNSVSSDTEES
ncbi:MAG: 4Fe-4S ferredoxin [bacterium]|nr:4Fe-4S ferredoxin [bacterium]